jgi:16S rRNA (guanine966-N2)-methyltransferase
MRITGGDYKSHPVNPPHFFKDRPTTDRAKEGLFNILFNRYNFEAITVLDLFAGTGGISYEFASRGCTNITAVEQNFKYCRFIRQQVQSFQFNEIHVICKDVFKALKYLNQTFDIVFADPPYHFSKVHELPCFVLHENQLLHSGGLFILEHSKNHNFSEFPEFFREVKYGAVHFSFFESHNQNNVK